MSGPSEAAHSVRWLAAGATLGLALAVASLVSGGSADESLPSDAVARVNGVVIRGDDFQRLVAGLESDTRQPIDDERRQHVLDRMIDEELLVQRALDLGLATVDRRVRADLTSALIASVVASAESEDPSDDELRAFYEENRDFFTVPGRLRARQVFFRVKGVDQEATARNRAAAARDRLLAGDPFESVREELGDPEISRVPDALLPPTKLREYLGPTAQRAVGALDVGDWSEPVRSGTGVHVLQLVEREPERTPELEAVRSNVAAEWRRRAGDRALREYLDSLRGDANVVLTDELAPRG